jgi:hypothetical protein
VVGSAKDIDPDLAELIKIRASQLPAINPDTPT